MYKEQTPFEEDVPKSPEIAPESPRDHIQNLKDAWNLQERGFYEDHAVGNAEEAMELFRGQDPDTKAELLKADLYITDVIETPSQKDKYEGQEDARRMQSGRDIAVTTPFLKKEMRCLMTQEIGDQLEGLLDDYLAFISEKQVLTRPGYDAIGDLLRDHLLTSFLVEQRSARMLMDRVDVRAMMKNHGIKINKEEAAETLNELMDVLSTEEREILEEAWNLAEIELYKDVVRLTAAVETVAADHQLEEVDVDDMHDPEADFPLELRVAIHKKPSLERDIMQITRSGAPVRFHSRVRTSTGTLEALHDISLLSQHKFQTNWLRPLVMDGIDPKLTIGSDIKKQMKDNHDALEKLNDEISKLQQQIVEASDQKKRAALEKKLLKAQQSAEKISEQTQRFEHPDLESDLELIREGIPHYKEFVSLSDEPLDPHVEAAMRRVNEALEPINRAYALKRMQFDISDEQTHEAQKVVEKMMFIGPIAHGLEHMDLGVMAKVFTSSADDLLGEYAEVKALLGAGYSMKDILERLKLCVPVFGAATYGASKVEELLKEGHPAAGGALFGATAVALSLTTAIQSIKMYRDGYLELVKEGKISGRNVVASHPDFKKQFAAMEKDLEGKDKAWLLAEVKKTLELLSELTEEEKKQILADLESLNEKALIKILKGSLDKEAWKQALIQDFNNPVRLGLLLGSASAPTLGMGLGLGAPSTLSNGFVLAGIGSMESIVGGMTVLAARKISDMKWKMSLQDQLPKPKQTIEDIMRIFGSE